MPGGSKIKNTKENIYRQKPAPLKKRGQAFWFSRFWFFISIGYRIWYSEQINTAGGVFLKGAFVSDIAKLAQFANAPVIGGACCYFGQWHDLIAIRADGIHKPAKAIIAQQGGK